MKFVTLADLAATIRRNVHKIPHDVDFVIGIPRSGIIAASAQRWPLPSGRSGEGLALLQSCAESVEAVGPQPGGRRAAGWSLPASRCRKLPAGRPAAQLPSTRTGCSQTRGSLAAFSRKATLARRLAILPASLSVPAAGPACPDRGSGRAARRRPLQRCRCRSRDRRQRKRPLQDRDLASLPCRLRRVGSCRFGRAEAV